jgi:AhpD family alkylhydroperoxidase
MPFLGQILGETSIGLATKELVIMRVSHLNGCRYCLAAHRPASFAAGVTERALDAACGAASRSTLDVRDQRILGWVDQVVVDARQVDDELVAATLAHVRADQLIELTLLAGAVTMLNQYCTALAIPPPESAA